MKKTPPPARYTPDRLIGLDIIRVFLAILIYLFHSVVHLNCDYGVFQDFVLASCTIAMTGFFMLSGFSLQIAYGEKDLLGEETLLLFFKKRIITIYPLYIVTGTFFVLMCIAAGKQSITDNIVLLPIELLGIQSFFESSLFQYSHNNGTWFISCLFVCYFFYPFLNIITKWMSFKKKLLLIFSLFFLLSYCPLLCERFAVNGLYTNPWFRLMEFTLGVYLAQITKEGRAKPVNQIERFVMRYKILIFSSLALIFIMESEFQTRGLHRDWLNVITVSCLLYLAGNLNHNIQLGQSNKQQFYVWFLYLSSITYAFFLGQFFVWNPMKMLLLFVPLTNLYTILLSFVACLVAAIFLHEFIEIRLGNYLKKNYL